MKCPKCQHENPEDSTFCGKCGTQVDEVAQPPFTKTLESPVEIPQGTVFAGKYEILEKLGRGGMGEVYRALDRNLGRQVAIKILPEEFSEDKERMARFEREAKLLAVLNHPHIASIYGLEESEGRRFLVLELIEGETLRTRLDRGSLSVEKALETCHQIAEGLEAAHEKGIIHRDLKPGNIMFTQEGSIKILDFGLAKACTPEATDIDIEKSPTITAQMTAPGVIMGTAAYMSPEQARSRRVDKKADIWAFGCVLYECLTGKRTFHGETVSDTLAHILKGEPDWIALPQSTSVSIRTLLRRCLQKNPRERLHDIADARIEIAEALSGKPVVETDPAHKPIRPWLLGALFGVSILAAILITWNLRPSPKSSPGYFSLPLEAGLMLEGFDVGADLRRPSRTAMAVAGDGSFIVYSAGPENREKGERPKIYLRRIDGMEAVPIPGTDKGIGPFLSPDNQWLGFWEGSKLKKVAVRGGLPISLCDWDMPFGADWGADNSIIFCSGKNLGLSRVSDEGGNPETLTVPDTGNGEYSHRHPHWLPGGKYVLFTIVKHEFDPQPCLAILDSKTGEWREMIQDAADGCYLRSGHLIFLRQGTLMAVAFDLDKHKPLGQPVPIVENVMQALHDTASQRNTAAGQYSVSDTGLLAYVPGGIVPDPSFSFMRVDLNGNAQPFIDFKGPLMASRFSPTGDKLVYQTFGKEWRVWIYDLKRNLRTPLMHEGIAMFPTWAPDGKHLIFGWSKSNPQNIYWQPLEGSSSLEQLTTSENWKDPGSFTPDGTTLAFVETHPETGEDVNLLDMKDLRVVPFLNSQANERYPEFSPDGRWLAYATDESGSLEVWIVSFPDQVVKLKISKEGGGSPIWRKDGKQLFYRSMNTIWVVDIKTEDGFSASPPRRLFSIGRFAGTGPIRNWDMLPDGQGFLIVQGDERDTQSVTEIVIIQNWFEELKRLVPVKK